MIYVIKGLKDDCNRRNGFPTSRSDLLSAYQTIFNMPYVIRETSRTSTHVSGPINASIDLYFLIFPEFRLRRPVAQGSLTPAGFTRRCRCVAPLGY
jgi:hypothetical protein